MFTLYNLYFKHIKVLLNLRSTFYSLKGTDIVSLCKPVSTSYGLHSFKYFESIIWKSLSENFRTAPSLSGFKRLVKKFSFSRDC